MKHIFPGLIVLFAIMVQHSYAQQHYFIDGYHGGKYGHYPPGFTSFIVEQLDANPDWKINLEIEPETWDVVRSDDPDAYRSLKRIFANQSDSGRIEYVNPGYGQSYLYTSSGESMIRQFSYGIQKIKQHFPEVVFTTYSSEEPCFTSALPQVLLSFGFRYASLKNPNTCWGGYTRAFGGELIQWRGPDGSMLPTVPRYSSEALLANSTWQTTAWNNGEEYIQSSLAGGITRPVGMCLQDAGWRNGPWLKRQAKYETWRNYINYTDIKNTSVWKLDQEDIQVSLVWGAQVLQRIAQQVRHAENKLAAAEKYAAINRFLHHHSWPVQALDTAWKSLLLSQHHDCWIVPYNGPKGDTWIDRVRRWTDMTLAVSDSLLQPYKGIASMFSVLNTTAHPREEWVVIPGYKGKNISITDSKDRPVAAYLQRDSSIVFNTHVPAMGYSVYHIRQTAKKTFREKERRLPDGRYQIETDMYRMVIDPARGGVIASLVAKKIGNREMVDMQHPRGFNELRGYFYNEKIWRSSMDTAATVRIKEDNEAQVVTEIKGAIGQHPFTQLITLAKHTDRIDMQLKIDWQGEPGVGAPQAAHFRAEDLHKAFYNDSFKLQVLFPLNLSQQLLSKDAPYDVTESHLPNTFFNSWDSIRNNVILHWADVTDGETSMTLFTDHTTSYVHGQQYPFGLTIQYAGTALWGRNYNISGPTAVRYAILPHKDKWDAGGVSAQSELWSEPLQVIAASGKEDFSLLSAEDKRWEIPALIADGNDLLVRIYNAAGDNLERALYISGTASEALLERLDGKVLEALKVQKADNKIVVRLSIPRFGIRTIRLKNIHVKQ